MEKLLAGLLAALQEPVVAALDGRAEIWNAPAEGCFPGLFRGAKMREYLPEELTEENAVCGSCEVGVVRVAEWNGYRLYTVLREGVEPSVLTSAGSEMRDILSIVALARDRAGVQDPEDEKQVRYAAMLNKSFYRLTRMADHLALLGEREPALQRKSFDFAELLRTIAMSVETRTGRSISVEAEEELYYGGDRELLEKLCLNLLSNALKYAPEGKVRLRLQKKRGRTVLTVADEGAGMAPEKMPAALLGTGGKTEYSDPSKGVGLGLAVVRRIAGLHGGTVVMESAEGKGTRVTVSLPETEFSDTLCSQVIPYASRGIDPVLEELSDILDWKAYRNLFAD